MTKGKVRLFLEKTPLQFDLLFAIIILNGSNLMNALLRLDLLEKP
jgi:hypothetical protein